MKTDHSIVNNIAFPVTKTTGTDSMMYHSMKLLRARLPGTQPCTFNIHVVNNESSIMLYA